MRHKADRIGHALISLIFQRTKCRGDSSSSAKPLILCECDSLSHSVTLDFLRVHQIMKRYNKIILVITIVFLFCSMATAGSIRYTKKNYAVAMTEELLDRAMGLHAAGDMVALQALLNTGLVFLVKAGVKVELMSVTFGGKAKIRPWGSNIVVWTVVDALD